MSAAAFAAQPGASQQAVIGVASVLPGGCSVDDARDSGEIIPLTRK
jgi:hypothetical protein